MENVTTVALTLISVLVGAIMVVLFQLHQALRNVQNEVREARLRLEPMFDRMNNSSQIATAVAMAVAAGVRAYKDAKDAKEAAAQPLTPMHHPQDEHDHRHRHEAHTARTHTTTKTTDQYEEAFR
jgi:NADH:ubiquinone oxidoreductase subunit 6 (subunit J)